MLQVTGSYAASSKQAIPAGGKSKETKRGKQMELDRRAKVYVRQ